jgi:hypothetical protein
MGDRQAHREAAPLSVGHAVVTCSFSIRVVDGGQLGSGYAEWRSAGAGPVTRRWRRTRAVASSLRRTHCRSWARAASSTYPLPGLLDRSPNA